MMCAAFKMKLKPGFEAEYKKRHDEIWPERVEKFIELCLKHGSIN